MLINVKKLHPNAQIPQYANPGDAALDLTSVSSLNDLSGNYVEYRTGLSFEIPEGYVGLLFPRSSISKKDLILSNSVGVLDSGYRGEVTFRFKRTTDGKARSYQPGDRIGQILILPYPQVTFVESPDLSKTTRGAGGYGSTGR